MALNEAVKSKPLSVECPISDMTIKVSDLLDKLNDLINDVKPINQPQRFGNQAFRTWYNILKEVSRL